MFCHPQRLTCIDGSNPWHLQSSRGVNADDACMSIRAEHQPCMQHTCHHKIACITSLPGQLIRGILPPCCLANCRIMCRFVNCLCHMEKSLLIKSLVHTGGGKIAESADMPPACRAHTLRAPGHSTQSLRAPLHSGPYSVAQIRVSRQEGG